MKLVLAILIIFFMYLSFSWADEVPPAVIGKIAWVQGTVSAINSKNETRPLKRQSPIYLQDTIITGADAGGQIVYTDNSLVSLAPNTKFKIENYSMGTDNTKPSFVTNVIQGGFRTITGSIPKKDPNSYQVNTPVATLGVRGTDYGIHVTFVEKDAKQFTAPIIGSKTYAILYEGRIFLKNAAGTIELDKNHPYAVVDGADIPPRFLDDKPPYFDKQLKIDIVTFAALLNNSDNGSNSGKGGGTQFVTEFCIK